MWKLCCYFKISVPFHVFVSFVQQISVFSFCIYIYTYIYYSCVCVISFCKKNNKYSQLGFIFEREQIDRFWFHLDWGIQMFVLTMVVAAVVDCNWVVWFKLPCRNYRCYTYLWTYWGIDESANPALLDVSYVLERESRRIWFFNDWFLFFFAICVCVCFLCILFLNVHLHQIWFP